jgi:hypothetical protein
MTTTGGAITMAVATRAAGVIARPVGQQKCEAGQDNDQDNPDAGHDLHHAGERTKTSKWRCARWHRECRHDPCLLLDFRLKLS